MENKLSYQMNVFSPTEEIKGRRALPANVDSFSGIVDESQTTDLLPGDPVKIVATTQGLPHFAKAAVGDFVMGFVEWNVIRASYVAGDILQVSPATNVMYMEVGGAVDAGMPVSITDLDNVYVGVQSGNASIIGWSLEAATAANQLIRVRIGQPAALAIS